MISLALWIASVAAAAAVERAVPLAPTELSILSAPALSGAAALSPSAALMSPTLSAPAAALGAGRVGAPFAEAPKAAIASDVPAAAVSAAPAGDAPVAATPAAAPASGGVAPPIAGGRALPDGEAARFEPERFWDGSDYSHLYNARPYWKKAFVENARLLTERAAWSAVPGFVSASHFSLRDQFGSPVPGLQIVLEPGADAGAVLGRLALASPALRRYRAVAAESDGRPVVYLARPVRKAFEGAADPREAAEYALSDDHAVSDALDINQNGMSAHRASDRLRRNVERPDLFADGAAVLRYAIFGERPAGTEGARESRLRFLVDAVRNTGGERILSAAWEGRDGIPREMLVAPSAETPADVKAPTAVSGAKTTVAAYAVTTGAPRAPEKDARLTSAARWALHGGGLLLVGAAAVASGPGFIWGLAKLCEAAPLMLVNPALWLGAPIIAMSLLYAGYSALAWAFRMTRLWRAVVRRAAAPRA